jgi:hypothetical protein
MGTTTSKHGFYKPAVNEDGWGATINSDNWDRLDARVPILDADFGFWAITDSFPQAIQAAVMVASANQVRAHRMVVLRRTTIKRIIFEITTLSAGGNCSIGIYSADGNTLLVHTGAVDTGTTGNKNIDVADATLDPGVYWLAWTADNTTVQCRQITGSTVLVNIMNAVAVRVGTAANASSGGVLPSTLGTITAAVFSPPAAFFDSVA